jgi:hypothetical protein
MSSSARLYRSDGCKSSANRGTFAANRSSSMTDSADQLADAFRRVINDVVPTI